MSQRPHLCAAFLPAAPLLLTTAAPLPSSSPSSRFSPTSLPIACVSQQDTSSNSNVFSSAVSLVTSLFNVFTPASTSALSPSSTSIPQSASNGSASPSPPTAARPTTAKSPTPTPPVAFFNPKSSHSNPVTPLTVKTAKKSNASAAQSAHANKDGLDARTRMRSDDDDGVHTRIAARRSRSTVPQRARKRRRTSPFPFFSRPETTPSFPIPTKPIYPGSLRQMSNDQIFFLLDSAVRRRASSKPNPHIETLLPYDLQRTLFDKLTTTNPLSTSPDIKNAPFPSSSSSSSSVGSTSKKTGLKTTRSADSEPDESTSLWDMSARFAVDAFRFVTFQEPQTQSDDTPTIDNTAEKQSKASAYTAAAMASVSEVASQAGGDATSAAAAYAAVAAIASSAAAAIHPAERAGLQAAVEAARAVANAEDAAIFVNTVGVAALVGAASVLPGAERASSLTALANIAIVLPKARKAMLLADNGAIVQTIMDTVLRNMRFSVPPSVNGTSLWYTEALVSGTHLLGSLALVRNKEGREFRAKMAKDTEIIRRLERIAGGLKNGEAEGAARAARRALGALGINRWKPRMPGQKGLRILSIDGGGTRAILAFETLKQLKKTTGCEIHELFDIICGTSTGAIVAASIGLGHKTVEEVDVLYRDMIGKVFARNPVNGPKMLLTRAYYDTNVLESTLQRECGRGVFIDSLADENMNRVFVVSSVMSRDPKELFVFRNYTYPLGHESRYDGTSEAQLWEGLRASSAAPTFFSEIRINGELHADGAIVANNPTAVALHETRCMFPGVPIELVVSLGNGVSPRSEETSGGRDDEERSRNLGWGDVVGSIVASATSTETVHHAMQDLFPEDKYFRFNPTTDSTQIDETAPETLAMFVKEAHDYIAANVDQFDRVARILRPKTPQSLWRRFRDALRKEIQELESTYWDDDLYLPK